MPPTSSPSARPPGDQAVVSVLVKVPPREAFRVFTEEIDSWWRAGLRYRIAKGRSVIHLEPKLGGRLYESWESGGKSRIFPTGQVTVWEPPERLTLEWRAVNFAPEEATTVDVRFEPSPSGTLVTLRHSGWSQIRPDHPVRHGQAAAAFIRTMGLWWADLLTALRERAENPGGDQAI
jgi:uncharacterized protein YndB with AHSA1/START domain